MFSDLPTQRALASAAFLILALLCLCVAWRAGGRGASRGYQALWVILAGLMLINGLNRPLGLLDRATGVGRQVAAADGWYEDRRDVQRVVVRALPVAAAIIFAICLWRVRRTWRRNLLPLLAVMFIAGYMGLRLVSLHGVDQLLIRNYGGLRGSAWIEGASMALLLAAIVWDLPLDHRRKSARAPQR